MARKEPVGPFYCKFRLRRNMHSGVFGVLEHQESKPAARRGVVRTRASGVLVENVDQARTARSGGLALCWADDGPPMRPARGAKSLECTKR
jgi:hypothetical protein